MVRPIESEEMPTPKYVSYVITSMCVADCEICLTPTTDLRGLEDLSTSDAKRVIDKVIECGAEMISFAGREPFRRKDIWELIEYVKRNKLGLNLESTSVTLKEEDIERLLDLEVDWLSLTADTLDGNLARKMKRPYVSREHLQMLCYKFSQRERSHLKVSSVVSQKTLGEMEEVGECLAGCPPEIWKLRQFTIRGGGEKERVRRRYDIPTDTFRRLHRELTDWFPEIYLADSEKNDYTGTLIMITPKGELILPYAKDNIFVGQLIEDNLHLKDVWVSRFPEEKKQMHVLNYHKSYIVPVERRC